MTSVISMSAMWKPLRSLCLVVFCCYLMLGVVSGYPRLRCPTSHLSDLDERDCTYGMLQDICGRPFCAKGPDEKCWVQKHWFFDNGFEKSDNCGHGNYCTLCSRCGGCSHVTGTCAQESCSMGNAY